MASTVSRANVVAFRLSRGVSRKRKGREEKQIMRKGKGEERKKKKMLPRIYRSSCTVNHVVVSSSPLQVVASSLGIVTAAYLVCLKKESFV